MPSSNSRAAIRGILLSVASLIKASGFRARIPALAAQALTNIFQRLLPIRQITIGEVIDKAAKLVQPCGSVGQFSAEKKAGPVE